MSKSTHFQNYKYSLKQQERLEPWQMPKKPKINLKNPTRDDRLFLQAIKDIIREFHKLKRKLEIAERNGIIIRSEIEIFKDENRHVSFQIDGRKYDIKYKFSGSGYVPYIECTFFSKHKDGLQTQLTYCSGIHLQDVGMILKRVTDVFGDGEKNYDPCSMNSFFEK